MKKIRLGTILSLVFALAVALTIFLVSVLSGAFISREFEDYVMQSQKEQADELAYSIGSQYDHMAGGWNLDYIHGMGMYALDEGFILRLYDSDRKILWDAENHDMALCHEIMDNISLRMDKARPDLKGEFVTYEYELKSQEMISGYLEISYYTPYYLDENEFQFFRSLNRILSLVGIVSLAIAIVFGALIARRITRPISSVVSAAGKISEGDYGVRVNTDLRELETYELAISVNHMAETLEEQEYLRKQMTGDIAHELRTPVTNITSYMEMMIDGVMEPTPERLSSCYNELSRLSGLIQDLEHLEETEDGSITDLSEDVDLYNLSGTIIKSFETGFKEKNIEVSFTGEEVHVCGDRRRLEQVASNLLSNAVKYTDENGQIRVLVKRENGNALLVVEDTGIGIPKEDLNRVFERFYRTDKSRTRKTGGAGIGLTITKAIVKAHGGSIRCESTPGEGSRFIVTLPCMDEVL